MSKSSVTVTGTLVKVRFFDTDSQWGIFRLQKDNGDQFEATGIFPCPQVFEELVLNGHWNTAPCNMPELAFTDLIARPPTNIDYLPNYLTNLLGINLSDSHAIVASFGSKTAEILDGSPERLTDIFDDSAIALDVYDRWNKHRGLDRLKDQMQIKGISEATLSKISDYLGRDADVSAAVRKNPFLLYKVSDDITFSSAKRMAEHYSQPLNSSYAIEGAIIAALRAVLNVHGLKHINKSGLVNIIKGRQFLCNKSISEDDIYAAIKNLDNEFIVCRNNIVQLKNINDIQRQLSTKLLAKAVSEKQDLHNRVDLSPVTIVDFDTIDQGLNWLNNLSKQAVQIGLDGIVITPNSGLAAQIDNTSEFAASDYLSMLGFTAPNVTEFDKATPFPADLVIVMGAHLIPDEALLLALEACQDDTCFVCIGSNHTIRSKAINDTFYALLNERWPFHQITLKDDAHWSNALSIPFSLGSLDLDLPISWVNCGTDKLIEGIAGINDLFFSQLEVKKEEMLVASAGKHTKDQDLYDDLSKSLSRNGTSTLDKPVSGDAVHFLQPIYQHQVTALTRWWIKSINDDETVIERDGQLLTIGPDDANRMKLANCINAGLAFNNYGRITLVAVHPDHVSQITRQTMILLRDTCSENLIFIGATKELRERWHQDSQIEPIEFSNHLEDCYESFAV